MNDIRILGSNDARNVVGGGLVLTGLNLANGAIRVARRHKRVREVEREIQSGLPRTKTSISNRGWFQTGVDIGRWLVNAIGS